MHPLVKKLEQKLLSEFERLAELIKNDFPNVTTRITSSSTGSETDYQGYSFDFECFLESGSENEKDVVYLSVSLAHLTTVPKIDADVSWGGEESWPSEASFRDWSGLFPDDGIEVSDEVIEELYKDLPRLYEALYSAIEAGRPDGQN